VEVAAKIALAIPIRTRLFLLAGPYSSKTFSCNDRLAERPGGRYSKQKGIAMSKKMMLLALAVASMTMFALPAASSAQEIHLEGVTEFKGDATAGSLTAAGEPTITCETGDVEGTVSAGGTTGSIKLDFTGCHTTVFGFTAKCHTAASPLDNTIKTSGTSHLITTSDGPALMVTTEPVEIICAGISNTTVHGDVIGTITSPKCGESSKLMTINFAASNNVQAHDVYTGVTHALTATTSDGVPHTAGLNTLTHVESTTAGTLNCT
jgi:hypothetical protein